MKKIPGVENVETSLKQGKAIVKLKPANTVRLEDLVQKVRDNAFNPKEARVSVRGEVVSSGVNSKFRVLGTNDVYDLIPGPQVNELKKHVGKALLVEGVIPAPTDKKPMRIMEVKSFVLSS